MRSTPSIPVAGDKVTAAPKPQVATERFEPEVREIIKEKRKHNHCMAFILSELSSVVYDQLLRDCKEKIERKANASLSRQTAMLVLPSPIPDGLLEWLEPENIPEADCFTKVVEQDYVGNVVLRPTKEKELWVYLFRFIYDAEPIDTLSWVG